MTSFQLLLLLFVGGLLLSSAVTKSPAEDPEEEEDLSFLEESDVADHNEKPYQVSDGDEDDQYPDLDDDDFESFSDFDESGKEELQGPDVDEKDVVILKERNFTDVVENNKFVMVEFYAPWCGHCQALAPEFAAAATALKEEGVVLAKVDATEENELAQEYDVQGFPTIHFFVDGEHKSYNGARSKEAIVTWIKKKTGPGVTNLTTLDDAERILTSESKIALGYLTSLVGPQSEELVAASRLEDDVNFYQTVNPDVAKLFNIDPETKRPALVLFKKEAEKISYFDGQFLKSAITEFVFSNKLPLVTIFTRESASSIFESAIKKQMMLFATAKDSVKLLPTFQEAAKLFKGKLIFVYVEMDNEDFGKPVAEYFGISGKDPKVIAYTGNEDGKKFVLDGSVTLDKMKAFAEDFLEDKLKPFFKSDPVPETNDGDVKVVVGNNFDEIVLDESKDVLLEIYAPWCGHCQSFEPTYSKLARHLRDIDSIIVTKMDGTTNEHPRAKADGFPTILFFPAGNKSFDPITVDADRTVVALYKFLKKHASIPFKLQKPTSSPKSNTEATMDTAASSTSDVKDEL